MVIGIFGESCVGKSTLADLLGTRLPARVYTGKDYLRLANNEAAAKRQFAAMLEGAGEEHILYVISEREHLALLPANALRVLVTADLAHIQSRFAARIGGQLPEPVKRMLEKKHGCFDAEPHHVHVAGDRESPREVCERVLEAMENI